MIGNRRGEFGVTWYEYKQWKNKFSSDDQSKDINFQNSIFANTPKRDILSNTDIAQMLIVAKKHHGTNTKPVSSKSAVGSHSVTQNIVLVT